MNIKTLKKKYKMLKRVLNERTRRLFAASEALAVGHGGIAQVSRALKIAYSTIAQGIRELKSSDVIDPSRVRKPGGGRKTKIETNPNLPADLESLVEPTSRGDPMSPLRWTTKSLRKLADALKVMGHSVSPPVIAKLLKQSGYSLQANRKTREGKSHPDRDAQFKYINRMARKHQRRGQPVISVDGKKKELVGDFANKGREWRPKGVPEEVRAYDFLIKENGKAAPYGLYDLTRNAGWVAIGIDHDTAAFAVNTIRHWWRKMGKSRYRDAKRLLITADSGGSNSSRARLWKWELQKLADETGLEITVCHFPPGTSKWNKIEHRLFSYISKNWRGRPLTSLAVIVNLIASTTTRTGLKIRCRVDMGRYPKGIKISDEQMAQVKLYRHEFHGDWNYTIKPHVKTKKTRK